MRFIEILDEAAEEAIEAAAWYEKERAGLGNEFYEAIDTALDLVENEAFPLLPVRGKTGNSEAKRIILSRFPYDIVVIERPAAFIVVAVAHHARKPGYWRERL